jgi:hypothetical protein
MKKDGSQRFYGNYCPLNHQTRQDSFPMPLIEDVLNQSGHSEWFSALDLQSRFWQILMALDDVQKIAMITKSGLYEWNVMPFGLKNATNTFSRTMVDIFKEWTNQFVKVFVDDVNTHNGTWNEHLGHIMLVFQKLKGVNLKLNRSKCCFGSKSITFLGHIVDNVGSQLDLRKIATIQHFAKPKTTTNVKAFLGLTRYYRRFVARYAKIVEPLFALTKKDYKFLWTPICQKTFIALKRRLVEAHVLVRPNFNRPFILDVNWFIRGCWSHFVIEVRKAGTSHYLCQQGLVFNPTPFSSHGGRMLCFHLGYHVF